MKRHPQPTPPVGKAGPAKATRKRRNRRKKTAPQSNANPAQADFFFTGNNGRGILHGFQSGRIADIASPLKPLSPPLEPTPGPRVAPWLELQVSTSVKPGSPARLSDATMLIDALSAHRDSKLKELRELADFYAGEPNYDKAGILEDMRSGEFAELLSYVESLSILIDYIGIELAGDLKVLLTKSSNQP